MSNRMDSKTVITAVIADPGTFPTVVAALDKDLPKHLAGHFKDKGLSLDRLRATHVALGGDNLALAFEGLDGKAVGALLKKVDPHRAPGEAGTDLQRLKDLAGGSVEPEPKPEKPKKATATKPRAPALTRAGSDKAAGAKGTGTQPTRTAGTEAASAPGVGASAKRSRSTKKAASDGQ